MNTTQRAQLGTSDFQAVDGSTGLWNSREMHLNERFISKAKRAYCNKYHLEQINVYEKAFSELNRRIFTEVQSHKKGYHVARKSENVLKIDDYSRLYRKNSQELIRLIQKHGVNESSGPDKRNILFNEVKRLEVAKTNLKENRHNTSSTNTLPKVYDYDETVKFKMSHRKNIKRLNSQSLQLTKKLNSAAGQDVFNSLPTYQPKEYGQTSFSKNAYLASLNVVFRNPII